MCLPVISYINIKNINSKPSLPTADKQKCRGNFEEKAQSILFLSFFDTIGPSLFCVFQTGAYRESFTSGLLSGPFKKYRYETREKNAA